MTDILETIASIPLKTVGENQYLPSDAIKIVADAHFPGDFPAALEAIKGIIKDAGFLEEPVQLNMPEVSYEEIGLYWMKRPSIKAVVIALLDSLNFDPAYAHTASPLFQIVKSHLHENLLQKLPGTSALTPEMKEEIHGTMLSRGWFVMETDDYSYWKKLPFSDAEAQKQIRELLDEIPADYTFIDFGRVLTRAIVGGYGGKNFRNVHVHWEKYPEVLAAIDAVLPEYGRMRQNNSIILKPMEFTQDQVQEIVDSLGKSVTQSDETSPFIVLEKVLLYANVIAPSVSINHLQDLLRTHPKAQDWLIAHGYNLHPRTSNQKDLTEEFGCDYVHLYHREAGANGNRTEATLYMARGFTVHTPTRIVDETNNTLVAMQMVGPIETVNANWAALVNGGESHWIGGTRIKLGGMKNHVRLDKNLPCGQKEVWLIHKQMSVKEMNPASQFYLLDNPEGIPHNFFLMLDKSIGVPLKKEWTPYLWLHGRKEGLCTGLRAYNCIGHGAWRVNTNNDAWEDIVKHGLTNKEISI